MLWPDQCLVASPGTQLARHKGQQVEELCLTDHLCDLRMLWPNQFLTVSLRTWLVGHDGRQVEELVFDWPFG